MTPSDLKKEAVKWCDDQKLTTHFEHGNNPLYPRDVVAAYVAGRMMSMAKIKELEKLISDIYDAQNG